jgi:hypothetical protein
MKTNLTEAEVQKFPLIHTFRNEWRQRWVYIHKHPTDETKVVTMGYPMAASGGVALVSPVICIEDKKAYEQILSRKQKVFE